MFRSARLTPEERKEFLGTSKPSLLASLGAVFGAAGTVLLIASKTALVLSFLGAGALAASIVMNLRRDFNVKWRRVNVVIHAVILFALAAATAAVLLRR